MSMGISLGTFHISNLKAAENLGTQRGIRREGMGHNGAQSKFEKKLLCWNRGLSSRLQGLCLPLAGAHPSVGFREESFKSIRRVESGDLREPHSFPVSDAFPICSPKVAYWELLCNSGQHANLGVRPTPLQPISLAF